MEKRRKLPELRFPEFNGDWDKLNLGKIAVKKSIKNTKNEVINVFTNSASRGIVNQRDYFDKDIANQNNLLNYYVVDNNDFIYNPRISNHAPVGPISRNHLQTGVMSPLYSVFKIKEGNLDFFEIYFSTSKWHEYMGGIANYGARSDRMNITTNDFYLMPLPFPSLPEQQKIASFLTAIDTKLTQLKQKKSLLEQYKKGVMQKVFSQEIRFKDEFGKEYPKWGKKTLKEISEIVGGGTPDTTKEEYWNGDINWFTPTELKSKYISESLRKISVEGLKQSSAKILPTGTLLFSSRATVGDISITLNDCCTNQGFQSFLVNALNSTEFLYYWITNNKKSFLVKASGSTFLEISKGEIQKIEIHLPGLAEQTKIANFLSAIDEKINHCQLQIEKTVLYKKGLLQKMFC